MFLNETRQFLATYPGLNFPEVRLRSYVEKIHDKHVVWLLMHVHVIHLQKTSERPSLS